MLWPVYLPARHGPHARFFTPQNSNAYTSLTVCSDTDEELTSAQIREKQYYNQYRKIYMTSLLLSGKWSTCNSTEKAIYFSVV